MTKSQALFEFFFGFGIPAYASSEVPEDVIFPYLTFDNVIDAFDGGEVSITVNLWYYTDSEAEPNAKAQEISGAIGIGGKVLRCDEGFIWLKRGSPWCQNLADDTNSDIKRRYLNISAEYLTEN